MFIDRLCGSHLDSDGVIPYQFNQLLLYINSRKTPLCAYACVYVEYILDISGEDLKKTVN